MRLGRRNALLLLLVAGLTALELVSFSTRRRPPNPTAVFAGLSVERIASLRIEHGDVRVELARAADASGWVVRQRFDYPAHGPAVDEFLARFVNLRSDDIVASDRSSHELFGLARNYALVSLRDAAGESLAELDVGRASDGTGSYVRLAGGDEVYRAAALGVVDAAPRHWLDTRLATFDVATVRALTLAGGELAAELTLERAEDGRWLVAGDGRSVVSADVHPLLVTAANLYFEDVERVLPAGKQLEPVAWSLRFECDGEPPVHLVLGPPPAPTSAAEPAPRSITRPDWPTPWIVRLPGTSAARLEATIARLLRAAS